MAGTMSRTKGQRWELACRKALTALGIPNRAPQPGEAGDDIILFERAYGKFSIEAKDQARDCLPQWVDQAARQAGDHRIGIVWHKRRGRPDPLDGYITLRARDFWERVA